MKNCDIIVVSIFIILSNVNNMVGVMGKFGGHDLFASLAELEKLWENDRDTVSVLENMAKKWKDLPHYFHM